MRNIKSELSNFLFSNKNNLIENGNFFAGLEATQTGDLDRSVGKNNFTRMNNPGLSQYVLEQNGIVGNYYNMKVTGIKPSTNYIFSCWVAWDSEFNGLKYVNLSTTFGNASSNSEASGFSKTENEFGVIIDGASTNVTITTAAPALSSATNNDFTIALELDGTVYSVVRSVVVKLVFSFLYIFAISLVLTK